MDEESKLEIKIEDKPESKSDSQNKRIYQLLLRCGAQRSVTDICIQFVKDIRGLIPYDQARILFLDKSGKLCGSKLFGVNERQWQDFMYYYENDMVFSQYSLKEPIQLPQGEKVSAHNYWYGLENIEPGNIFLDDYVHSLHLCHSLGIGFADQDNCIRSIITLDRVHDVNFSYAEISLAKAIQPLIENYHVDLLLSTETDSQPLQSFKKEHFLTTRETEIVGLLLDGLTPALIARRLNISVKTVYRHIANIYQKCRISIHIASCHHFCLNIRPSSWRFEMWHFW